MGPTFGDAVYAHVPALRALAMRLCRNAADAEDLLQEVLERSVRTSDRLVPNSNVRSWLLMLLHHCFIDRCRSRDRRPREDRDAPAAVPEEPPAWANITEEELRAAVAKLPDELRTIYVLRVHGERTLRDIARILGIATMTAGTRLLRARCHLRELLLPQIVDANTRHP